MRKLKIYELFQGQVRSIWHLILLKYDKIKVVNLNILYFELFIVV